MNRPSSFIWLAIIFILLLPSTVGKFFLDIAGGLILFILFITILITGGGWIGWKIIQSKLQKCDSCGTSFFNTMLECPICGEKSNTGNQISENYSQEASTATIDIKAEDAK